MINENFNTLTKNLPARQGGVYRRKELEATLEEIGFEWDDVREVLEDKTMVGKPKRGSYDLSGLMGTTAITKPAASKKKVMGTLDDIFINHADVIEDQRARFDAVSEMSLMTATGLAPSLIISGPAGVGKTWGVERQLEKLEASGEVSKSEQIKGFCRPTGLYIALWENRLPGQVVLIDDCDSIFRDENALNLLKAALDSSPVRTISWRSQAKLETMDGEVVPNSFDFEGSVIFLTNINFDKEIQRGTKMAPHFEALISRSHYIDIGIEDSFDKMIRVIDVAIKGGMFTELGLNEDQSRDVMNWMMRNNEILREVSLRMAKKLGDLALASKNWERIASITCLKH